MKTWEKVYWAVLGFLYGLIVISTLLNKGDISVTIQNKTTFVSKGKFIGYFLLIYLLIFAVLWVIIRLIVNKGWEDSGRFNCLL